MRASYQWFLFLCVTSRHVLIRAAQIRERKNNKRRKRTKETNIEEQTEREQVHVCMSVDGLPPALIHMLFSITIPDTASEKL